MIDSAFLDGDLSRLHSWVNEFFPDTSPEPTSITVEGRGDDIDGLIDAELANGANLLVLRSSNVEANARAIVSSHTHRNASELIARTPEVDDTAWMRQVAAVRDLVKQVAPDPLLEAASACLLSASQRSTPIIFDGVGNHAAALLAADGHPGASRWWLPATSSSDPAIEAVQRALHLRPAANLRHSGIGDEGIKAALALLHIVSAPSEN